MMKFVIECAYEKTPEKMLKEYPFLREYGFETIKVEHRNRIKEISYIYITNIEELLRLYEQCEEELVITRNLYTNEKSIEIYDGYRE